MRPPRRADRLLERGLDHRAVGIVRQQRGERALALLRPRSRRCARRRTPAGSSADRRRARRRWRRSRTRSPACCARARAARPAPTECANSGPRMISAPSSSACCAACCAPGALPPSSFTRSWMSGLLNSASAISAALRIDCAATPALPARRQRQDQSDLDLPGADLAAGCCRRRRLRAGEEIAAGEAARAAGQQRAAAMQRGKPMRHACAADGAGLAPAMLGTSAVSSAPTAQRRRHFSHGNQAFCRRIVNRMKRITNSYGSGHDAA